MTSTVRVPLARQIDRLSHLPGDIVRWAPNELSFANSAAWKDIYSPRKSGQIFTKDPKFYLSDETYVHVIVVVVQKS